MKAELLSTKRILMSYTPYVGLGIFCVLMFGVIVTGLVVFGLNQVMELEDARLYGLPISAILLILGIVYYVRYVVGLLGRYRFEIEGDKVTCHGNSGWSFLRKEFDVDEIQAVSLSDRLSLRDKSGNKYHIDFVAHAFDRHSLVNVLAKIAERGVPVAGAGRKW